MSDELERDRFVIQADTPRPPRPSAKYPIELLKVGESLTARATVGALCQAVRRYRLQHPEGRFTVRNAGDGTAKICRLT